MSDEVYMVDVTTLPDTVHPEPSGTFSTVTESSFVFRLQQDEPGTALVAVVLPRAQGAWSQALSPGASMSSMNVPILLDAQQVSGVFLAHPGRPFPGAAHNKRSVFVDSTLARLKLQQL